MLSLHLLQVSLVYVNTLMMQQVLAQPVAGPSHCGGPQGPLTAEVATRQPVWDLHPEHARAPLAGTGVVVP